MTQDEFLKIAVKLKAAYPDPKFLPDKGSLQVWYEMLQDIPFENAKNAVQTFIATNRSLPTIADLRELAREAVKEDDLSPLAAWSIVEKAVRNSLYGAEEEFEKLPPVIQRSVGSPANLREWAQMERDAFHSVEQSHFIRAYRAESEREKRNDTMPENLQRLIHKAAERLEGS